VRILLCLWYLWSVGSVAVARTPNIIHIIGDDVGYDDLGCFGAKDIRTPHLDKLAAQGIKFTSFYAPSPTCTPTRAALMTGCYAQRVGCPQVLFPYSKTGLSSNEITIAELLKERGYATGLIGKWHLGFQPQFLPPAHGFDVFLGIPYPNDHGPERLGWSAQAGVTNYRAPPIPLIRGTAVTEAPAQLATLPERFTREAISFIRENKERAFYLHLANIETHTPWLTSAPFHYKSKAGVYGDAVECLDWTVGEILKTLDELGLADNTLVVFTSDNGPLVHRYPELEGIYGHAAHVRTNRLHKLREGKYQAHYEGGTRVACLMRWPGKIPAQAECHEIAAGFDLFTTFARIGGAEIPADRIIDGKDLWPLMTAQKDAKTPHEAFFYYQGFNLQGVRSGPWKLVFGALDANGKPTTPTRQFLYNLEKDPGETSDLLEANPEVANRLRALAEKMREDLGDNRRDRPGKNRRPPGKA
jgi:arylsulfatase A